MLLTLSALTINNQSLFLNYFLPSFQQATHPWFCSHHLDLMIVCVISFSFNFAMVRFPTWTPSSFLTQESLSILQLFLPYAGWGLPNYCLHGRRSLSQNSYVDFCAECTWLGCSVHTSFPAFPAKFSISYLKLFCFFSSLKLSCWYYHLPRYPSSFIFIPNHWDLMFLNISF